MIRRRTIEPRLAGRPLGATVALCVAMAVTVLLIGACGDTDSNVVLIQKIGEGRVADEEDVRFLLDRLEHGNAEERLSSAWALGQTGRTDALPQLTRAAEDDPSTDVRINAIGSIDLLSGATFAPSLIELLDDENDQIRAAALRGLADSPGVEIVDKVGPLLVDGGDATRALAADVLGSSGDPRAIAFLVQVADDADFDVRTRVAFALGKLRDPASVPTLVAMLDDESWEVRANAVQALGMIGDSAARVSVEPLTDDPNSMVRQVAEATLEKLR